MMVLVDWKGVLGSRVRVTFSTLALPDVQRDDLDDDLAEVVLPDGRVLDVEWADRDTAYFVTLFRRTIHGDEVLRRHKCRNAEDVVDLAKRLLRPVEPGYDSGTITDTIDFPVPYVQFEDEWLSHSGTELVDA